MEPLSIRHFHFNLRFLPNRGRSWTVPTMWLDDCGWTSSMFHLQDLAVCSGIVLKILKMSIHWVLLHKWFWNFEIFPFILKSVVKKEKWSIFLRGNPPQGKLFEITQDFQRSLLAPREMDVTVSRWVHRPIFVKSQIIKCREIAGKLLPFSSSKYFPSFTVCTAGEINITSWPSCDAKNAILQRKNQRPASDGGLQPASLGPAWDWGPRPEVQQEEEDGALLQPPPPQRHQWHGGSFMPMIEWFFELIFILVLKHQARVFSVNLI